MAIGGETRVVRCQADDKGPNALRFVGSRQRKECVRVRHLVVKGLDTKTRFKGHEGVGGELGLPFQARAPASAQCLVP